MKTLVFRFFKLDFLEPYFARDVESCPIGNISRSLDGPALSAVKSRKSSLKKISRFQMTGNFRFSQRPTAHPAKISHDHPLTGRKNENSYMPIREPGHNMSWEKGTCVECPVMQKVLKIMGTFYFPMIPCAAADLKTKTSTKKMTNYRLNEWRLINVNSREKGKRCPTHSRHTMHI